jgi:hypothetical protein
MGVDLDPADALGSQHAEAFANATPKSTALC